MLSVTSLKARFYDRARNWQDGTSRYLSLVSKYVKPSHHVLDIGAGDGKGFAHPLRGQVKELVGLDPDESVFRNISLDRAVIGRAERIPLPNSSFDVVVSSFTLEHIQDPVSAASEIFRILRPGGVFVFRTPNLYHYVTLVSWLTPQWFHVLVANRLRALKPEENPAPWPTAYRCNTRRRIRSVFENAGFAVKGLTTIEPEPSYLQFSAIAFLLGVGYERIVNCTKCLAPFRVTILGVLGKPSLGEHHASD